MRFALSLAFVPMEQLLPLAQAAEAAGFTSLAVSDHVVHPQKIATPYPYTADGAPRWQPFTDWPEPWVAIGAMAAVTERLEFLTSVYVLPLRNPFLVAKAVSTAAVLSGDRVALGVGAGWMREEFELMEQSFARRGRRMDEMLDVMRKLWGGGMVEHHGEFYDFEPMEMSPVPARRIPIYVGGLSEAALRRAAQRSDGWLSELHSTDELRELAGKLAAYRADSPKAGEALRIFAAARDAYDLDGYRRLDEAGLSDAFAVPWRLYPGMDESLETRCDALRRFGDEIIAKQN